MFGPHLGGTSEQRMCCTTLYSDPTLLSPQHLVGRSTGRENNWQGKRQREVSALPHARECPGGEEGARRLCSQDALSDRPKQMQAMQSLILFTLPALSTEGGNKGWLYGSLWGADWEPSHHMVNKCCNCPTAERRLHVIKRNNLSPDP